MQILIWTFGLLTIFSFATYSRFDGFKDDNESMGFYLVKKNEDREVALKFRKKELELNPRSYQKHDVEPSPHSKSEKVLYLDFLSFNAKLNIYFAMHDGKDSPQYHLTARFFSILSPNESIETYYKILNQILEKASYKEEMGKILLSNPTDLAAIKMDTEEQQEIFYQLLKGPLLDFITVEPNRRKRSINLHYAPVELIEAIFEDKDIAQEIVTKREILHKEGIRETSKKHSNVTSLFLSREDVDDIVKSHRKTLVDYDDFIDLCLYVPNRDNISPHFCVTSTNKTTGITSKKKLVE